MATTIDNLGTIRVRFGVHRVDLPWVEVDFSRISTDRQVRRAVADALGVPAADLADAAVDRHPNGNMTVRPIGPFG